jgi:hypothetical protein
MILLRRTQHLTHLQAFGAFTQSIGLPAPRRLGNLLAIGNLLAKR